MWKTALKKGYITMMCQVIYHVMSYIMWCHMSCLMSCHVIYNLMSGAWCEGLSCGPWPPKFQCRPVNYMQHWPKGTSEISKFTYTYYIGRTIGNFVWASCLLHSLAQKGHWTKIFNVKAWCHVMSCEVMLCHFMSYFMSSMLWWYIRQHNK